MRIPRAASSFIRDGRVMVSPFDLPRCESLATMVSVCMFAPLSLATLVATRSQLVKSHYTYTNFAPRLGLAYSPKFQSGLLEKIFGSSGTTSVRAGYGMFYTAFEGLSAGIMSANPPYGYDYDSSTIGPPLFATPFVAAATGQSIGRSEER